MNIAKMICIIALLGVVTSCNDNFLERYPLASLSPETYFQSEAELRTYTNAFYNVLPDNLDIFHNGPVAGDDESNTSLRNEFRGTRTVPASGGGWTWTELRRINFFLENSHKCTDERVRARYDGLARFFRAWFYFDKIKQFGDVPWYDYVLAQDDEGLTKARDSRVVVFNHMLEDINYAIDNLETTRHTQLITKWTALALKSRMCLFEGTFRKYHGIAGWEAILRECVDASDNLITNSGYRVYTSSKDRVYQEMFVSDDANSEMILARQYNNSIPLRHSTNFYTLSNSYGRPGVNRSLINSYLKTDGSRFTDNPNYLTMQWYEEMQDRDPRLTQTVRGPGHKIMNESNVSLPVISAAITGYQWSKYITSSDVNVNNINDMPIIRYAEILLNYAEAKAELGEITQTDIDKTIKLLRDRVQMPNLIVADANQNPDPYIADQYPRVSGTNKGIILEIRRERRIELVREGFRYDDVIRWKEGQLFARVWNGMYFPGPGEYDLDHDGVIDLVIYEGAMPDPVVSGRQYAKLGEELIFEKGVNGGQIITNATILKNWNEDKDYVYPIPTQDRELNPNLTQNPGWPLL